jgi:hypothetical protein
MDETIMKDTQPMNRRSRLPWIMLGLVVAVIAGVTLFRQFRSTAEPGSSVEAANTDRAGGMSLQRLSPDELRALASRSPAQTGPATARDMAGMMEKRKRIAEATQARIEKRNTEMSSRYSAEKIDPKWSTAHAQELGSLQDSGSMRDAGAKVANFQADCRSTMCRIQGDFPNPGMAADWLQLYMGSVGDRLPVATAHQIRNPDGSVRVEIYGVGRK